MLEDDEVLKIFITSNADLPYSSENKDELFFVEIRLYKPDYEYKTGYTSISYTVKEWERLAKQSNDEKVKFFLNAYTEIKKFYINRPDNEGWWTVPR